MPRRKKQRHWMDSAPLEGLAGLLALGLAFSPAFRALLLWAAILAVVTGVIVLVIVIVLKARRAKQNYESVVCGPISQSETNFTKQTTTAPEHQTDHDDTRYQPRDSAPYLDPVAEITPTAFTPELLSALEWRRFEILVTLFFQKTGYQAQRNRVGADGGVDIVICHPGELQPSGYVQCKAWHVYTVGVKPIRELFGVMAADKIPHGFFVTVGNFTSEAVEFARGKSLILVNGTDLLKDLNGLPFATRCAIIDEITTGDYTTPTCPRCDVKMAKKTGANGPFWGCSNFPRCHQTLNVRSE